MIGRTNTGGGGTGATLTVSAPAGAVVTVSKDGKTKTKTAGADGVAVFKGLPSGEWTLSITDGTQTAQKTVTITADYTAAITFFAATIHVTYPVGSTCTATDGVTTLTAPDTSGTWACVVPNAGTWRFVTNDGKFKNEIEITKNGQTESISLRLYWFDGAYLDKDIGTGDGGAAYKITNDGLCIGLAANSSSGASSGGARSANKVDVSPFNLFCFEVVKTNGTIYGGVSTTTSVDPGTKITAKVSTNIAKTCILDVSNMSGQFYLAISFGYIGKNVNGIISRAWLE